MLASDLDNQKFQGATNPDSLLHVEFMWKQPVDKWKTEHTGKEVLLPRLPYIRIMRPGDQTSVHETPVRDDHKRRFAQKWLAWQMKEGLIEGANADVPGWKLEDWPQINETQRRELQHMRFSTVEQVAGASDGQIQRIGIGGVGLREQARAALKAKNRSEFEAEIKAKDKEMVEMRERLAKLEAMLPQVGTQVGAKSDTLHVPKKG
jgi:hypothetical protein